MKAVPAAIDVPDSREVDELEVARELVRLAREAGVALTGPGGLLKAMTKTVIESALDEELSEHLGYDRHDPAKAPDHVIVAPDPLETGLDQFEEVGHDFVRRAKINAAIDDDDIVPL